MTIHPTRPVYDQLVEALARIKELEEENKTFWNDLEAGHKQIEHLEAQHCIHWDQCVDYEHDLGGGR